MDFTLKTYKNLLHTLKTREFSFHTFSSYLQSEQTNEPKQQVILRHDVDRLPNNAVKMAMLEKDLGIQSSYYFRAVPGIFKPEIMEQIAGMGHEIGYHYEDLSLAAKEIGSKKYEVGSKEERGQWSEISGQKKEGKGQSEEEFDKSAEDTPLGARGEREKEKKTKKRRYEETKSEREEIIINRAYELFKHHLQQFRQYYPVKTICMHGSPRSKWDSRDIWKKYDYKELGIIGEPYFDIDYNEVFYLTDTGRRWDGWKMNVRDKVDHQEKWKAKRLVFHSTNEIIKAAENNQLPNKIIINTHPHRWFENYRGWTKELIVQNLKNVVKRLIVKYKK